MKKLQRRAERFKGETLGLDLHKKMIRYSVLNTAGDEVANEQIAACAAQLEGLIDRCTADGAGGRRPLQVVLEASGCFVWAYDLLVAKLGKPQVHVAAPSRGQAIARLWACIGRMDDEVAHWRDQVKAWSTKFDQVRLMDHPLAGVGPAIAAIGWSELGDPRRPLP